METFYLKVRKHSEGRLSLRLVYWMQKWIKIISDHVCNPKNCFRCDMMLLLVFVKSYDPNKGCKYKRWILQSIRKTFLKTWMWVVCLLNLYFSEFWSHFWYPCKLSQLWTILSQFKVEYLFEKLFILHNFFFQTSAY